MVSDRFCNFSLTFPSLIKSISSSGKSKHASTYILSSIKYFSKLLISKENLPDKEFAALCAASAVEALIKSAIDSA